MDVGERGRVYPISCVYSGRLSAAVGSFTHILSLGLLLPLCSPDIASYVEKPTTLFLFSQRPLSKSTLYLISAFEAQYQASGTTQKSL